MAYLECPDCGKKVPNLLLHLTDECPKRTKKKLVEKERAVPVEKRVEVKAVVESVEKKVGRGRPKVHGDCACGGKHYAGGLCKRCYQRKLMKERRVKGA